MHKVKHSGLFAAFAAAALIVLGCGIYGLATDTPSPVKSAVMAVTVPVNRGITAVATWFDSVRDYMRGIDDLKAENAELRRELASLENEIRKAQGLEEENDSLRALLEISTRHEDYDLQMAQVVGTETGAWGYSYMLDAGTESGIAAGQCVIVDEGMVGWIREAGEGWASLLPLTSTELKAGGVVARTREIGVLEGDFTLSAQGQFKLSYLPDSPQVIAGDVVETSGSGGKWPSGLAVGKVTELRLSTDGLSRWAILEPVCSLEKLSTVYVVRSFSVES